MWWAFWLKRRWPKLLLEAVLLPMMPLASLEPQAASLRHPSN